MAESLRDQLEANLDSITTTQAPDEATPPAATTTEPAGTEAAGATPAPTEATETQKGPGRTAGRPRDASGRLLPGKAQKPASVAAPATATPPAEAIAAAPAPAAEAPIKRPSTWKKETWALWDKVEKGEPLTAQEARQFAEEAARRDSDYSKGVSTYKTEYERGKPFLDVVRQNEQVFKQYGIDPARQFSKYIEIHKGLALGTPEQKLGMFLQLAQDYQIPVQNLFTKGEDGQIYFNPQIQAQRAQPQAPDFERLIDQKFAQREIANTVASFEREAAEKYPHYEEVKPVMAQLLESGIPGVIDLHSAYEAAVALPQFSHLTQADRQQAREREEAEKRAAAQAAAQRARANTVSTRSQTPTNAAATGQAKGLRGQLEENANAIFAGRV